MKQAHRTNVALWHVAQPRSMKVALRYMAQALRTKVALRNVWHKLIV